MNSALPSDSTEVKQYVRQFEDHELRKVLYDAARQKRANGEIRDAIKIVLLGWNWRAYNDTDLSNEDLNRQVEGFIESNRRLLDYLASAGHTLETINLEHSFGGTSLEEHMVKEFNDFLDNPAIGYTGASKAFHMLYPAVFMMWDQAIKDAYHQEGEPRHRKASAGKGEHTSGTGECYVVFLKEIKEFVESELDMKQFSNKTPAKVMDEYNYAKYTL